MGRWRTKRPQTATTYRECLTRLRGRSPAERLSEITPFDRRAVQAARGSRPGRTVAVEPRARGASAPLFNRCRDVGEVRGRRTRRAVKPPQGVARAGSGSLSRRGGRAVGRGSPSRSAHHPRRHPRGPAIASEALDVSTGRRRPRRGPATVQAAYAKSGQDAHGAAQQRRCARPLAALQKPRRRREHVFTQPRWSAALARSGPRS